MSKKKSLTNKCTKQENLKMHSNKEKENPYSTVIHESKKN